MPDHTRRFGLVIDFTLHVEGVEGGVLIQNSFWCVDEMMISPRTSIIRVWYHGWESVQKYDQGFPALPGAERIYQLDGVNYEGAVMTQTTLPTGSPIAAELMGMINAMAIATKDVHVQDAEPISFFEHAQPA